MRTKPVAGRRTGAKGKTVLTGAGVPSLPQRAATGHQNPSERSFAFGEPHGMFFYLWSFTRSHKYKWGNLRKSPCDHCPKHDDCADKCAEYWKWYFGGGR